MSAAPKEIIERDGLLYLSADGERIVKRGGADGLDDDEMLLYEILHRAPGMKPQDLHDCFVSLGVEYGADALHAIRSGHVRFEKRKPQ